MSIIDNATTKDVQNVINGVTPPAYSNEAGKTPSAISITVNGSTRTFNGSAAVNLGSIYAPTSAGSNGQVLISGGGVGQAPTWQNERIASVNDSSSRGQDIYAPTSRGTDGYVWEAQGGSQSPSWQQPIITSVNGNQNRGQAVYVPTSQGSNGQVWTSTGGNTPAWSTPIITSLNGSQSNGRSIYAPTSVGSNGQVLVSNGSGAPSWQTPSISYTQSVYYKEDGDGYNSGGSYAYLKSYTLHCMRVGDCCIIGGYIDDGNFCTQDRWIRVSIPSSYGIPCSVTVTPRRGRANQGAPEYCAMIDGQDVYMCCDENTSGDEHWGAFFTILCA